MVDAEIVINLQLETSPFFKVGIDSSRQAMEQEEVLMFLYLGSNVMWSNVMLSNVSVPGGGALPYVGGYQVPVNRPPFLTPILHPMTPFFIRFTPNDPLFPTFESNFT